MHPEERRIAGLLRELIVQSGTTLEMVEQRLGWEPGRLRDLLAGQLRLSVEDVLDVLPLLSTTPSDFFAWLYGFDPRETGVTEAEGLYAREPGAGPPAQREVDRRFEASLRAVRDAVHRRNTWKRERTNPEKT